MKNKQIKIHASLMMLVIIAILFRYWLVSDNHIYFWYDQARDAHVSQQMIFDKDIKIQGPSASGTNDTIYHGVLYYYILGPLYVLFNGDPYFVAIAFGTINSFGVVLIYYLSKLVFANNRAALIAAGVLAISFENSEYSTWLSNPMMGLIPVLIFFISVWKVFYEETDIRSVFPVVLMGISLGVIEQSAFYSVYFFGVILLGIIYASLRRKKSIFTILNLKELAAFIFSFGFVISSMIVNQLLLYKAGIFNSSSLGEAFGSSSVLLNPRLLGDLFSTYFIKIGETLAATMTKVGLILSLMIIYALCKKASKPQRWFLLSWIFAPLWLFVFHFRSSPHMLLGIEYVLIISLAFLIEYLFQNKNKIMTIVGAIVLLLYGYQQFSAVNHIRFQQTSIFTFQKGVVLKNSLSLIDRSYQLSEGEPFSISIWGSPYEYYISWAYLYDWHGKKAYGYVPSYYGTSQVGKYGPELLEQVDSPESRHFLIEEPEIVLLGNIKENFLGKQNSHTVTKTTDMTNLEGFEMHGEYRLQPRVKKTVD